MYEIIQWTIGLGIGELLTSVVVAVLVLLTFLKTFLKYVRQTNKITSADSKSTQMTAMMLTIATVFIVTSIPYTFVYITHYYKRNSHL